MKICIPISYYRPNVSGLTMFAEQLAMSLAEDGHDVTVVTSKLKNEEPTFERFRRLKIIRLKPRLRISKFIWIQNYENILERIILAQDLIFAQFPLMPQETLSISRIARRLNKPLVVMYHCDVRLGTSFIYTILSKIIERVNSKVLYHCKSILVTSIDYAENSGPLKKHLEKCIEIPPLLPNLSTISGNSKAFKIRERIDDDPNAIIIGCVARISSEKGVEYLIQAIPLLKKKLDKFKIAIVGDSTKVLGEKKYKIKINKLISDYQDNIVQLGYLTKDELLEFYAVCDLTVLPSINSTESFGLTQIESMLAGTPVVATNLPGVRQSILRTGMGKLVEAKDVNSLTNGILQVIHQRDSLTRSRDSINTSFNINNPEFKISKVLESLEEIPKRGFSLQATIDSMLRHSPPFTAMVRSIEIMILDQYKNLKSPLLDLGCENGAYSQYALNSSTVCSVDKRLKPLKEALLNLPDNNLLQADSCALPFPDESFETIVCNSVLEHIPNLDLAISELYRVLKKQGTMFVTMPNDNFATLLFGSKFLTKIGLTKLSFAYQNWFNQKSQHYHCYSSVELNGIFTNKNFKVIKKNEYLSTHSHHFFDLLHFISIPRLLTKRILGEWVPFPFFSLNLIYAPLILSIVDPKIEATSDNVGPYTFLELRK